MTPTEWALLGGLLGAVWLVGLSPLLAPLYFALRFGKSTPRRWLFVFLVACICEGLFSLLMVLLWVPVRWIGGLVLPQLHVDLPGAARVLSPIVERLYTVQVWFWLPALVAFSVWFSRYAWRRWPRIEQALRDER